MSVSIDAHRKLLAAAVCVAAATVVAAASRLTAEAPLVYAITDVRIVPVAGPPVEHGAVVLRRGVIEAVGASVKAPADAVIIDGKGMTVYPGLIDMGGSAGLDTLPTLGQSGRSREDNERTKRRAILRPQLAAADLVRMDAPALAQLASAGITSMLATPPAGVIAGQSALINTAAPPEDPQIGDVASERNGIGILRTPVALHVSLPQRPPQSGYPESLMGAIAFVRQSFLDAQHYGIEIAYAARVKTAPRVVRDEALDALQPAVAGRLPVVFHASSAREIRRALALARELSLTPVISGGHEADQTLDEITASRAPVVFSLDYPTRPRSLAPDAEEPLLALQARADAPRTPAALERAGISFAFASAGLREPRDFVANAAKAVRAGLSADAAIKALTLSAAAIAGVSDRLGSIEPGKIANIIVADGDLFDERTKITRVFIDGRPVRLDRGAPTSDRLRSGSR